MASTRLYDTSLKEGRKRKIVRILFIDDDRFLLAAWQRMFSSNPKVAFAECHSVEEALTAVAEYKPEIVFLDHHLTEDGSEGLAIADQLQNVVIYSTTSDPSFRREYEKRGIKAVRKNDRDMLKSIIEG